MTHWSCHLGLAMVQPGGVEPNPHHGSGLQTQEGAGFPLGSHTRDLKASRRPTEESQGVLCVGTCPSEGPRQMVSR